MSNINEDRVSRTKRGTPRVTANGIEVDARNVKASPKILTRKISQEKTIDFGETSQSDDEINFGIVETPASSPHLDALKLEYTWRKYAKQTQITILAMLLLVVVITLAAEMLDAHLFSQSPGQTPKSYLKDVLGYVIPIFTFMLGMGSQNRDER